MGRINKVLIWQFIMTLAISSILYAWLGTEPAQAALFGGFTAVMLSILLKVMVESFNNQLANKKNVHKSILMLLFIPRLLIVISFFGYGIGMLHLDPIPMVTTFALVYLVYWMDWKFCRTEETRHA